MELEESMLKIPGSKLLRMILLYAVLVGVIRALPVQALECHVDRTANNVVKFISDAPFEDFEGVTGLIDGYVYWDGDSLYEGGDYRNSELYLEVGLDNLDTGIGMRNRDMREDYLETDKYPYAHYSAKIVAVQKQGDEFLVSLDGEMFIHGVTRRMPVVGTVMIDGDVYRIRCQFDVILPDFNIKVPKLLFLRINEKIEIELDFFARAKNR